jgi:CBS domain-containing protein
MVYLLIVILDDLKRMPGLLRAWQEIGLLGATILQSAGAYRTTTWLTQVGLGALDRLFEAKEVSRRTLLVAVEGDELLEQAIAEAERVMGGFDRPDSGLLLVLPVAHVRGLHKVQPKPHRERLPRALRPEWMVQRDTPVEEAALMLELQPTLVQPETRLDEVARAMLDHPRVHVVCVVNREERLIGVLDLRTLADNFFFRIIPEEFLSEATDLDHALQFAEKSGMRTVADAMKEPVWVKRGETVKDAFKRMHEHGLPGLPVVDNRNHVVGYINLLELMAVCVDCEQPAEAGE